MATKEEAQLVQVMNQKVKEIKRLCQGLDEETASREPAGRWSVKQVLSHLCGPDGIGYYPMLRIFLDQDEPRLDLDAENPFYSEKRAKMTLAQLVGEFEQEYGRIGRFVQGLTDEQLRRKAHIPMLKDSPLGERPTLAQWASGLAEGHLDFHIDHLRQIRQALGLAVS
jgi:hypothetical protein